jgi:hypothetical protein
MGRFNARAGRKPVSEPAGSLKQTPGAIRARRYRQRNGLAWVFPVEVGSRVLEALIDRGMTESDSKNRDRVAAELGVVLMQWAERWFDEKRHA